MSTDTVLDRKLRKAVLSLYIFQLKIFFHLVFSSSFFNNVTWFWMKGYAGMLKHSLKLHVIFPVWVNYKH